MDPNPDNMHNCAYCGSKTHNIVLRNTSDERMIFCSEECAKATIWEVHRIFVGVHRSVVFPPRSLVDCAGPLIDAATRLRFPATREWSFPEGPATHAFAVMRQGSKTLRLDAGAPFSTLTHYVPPTIPTVLWELHGDTRAAARSLLSFSGAPYDLAEMALQVAFPLAGLGVGVDYAGAQAAKICTTLTCQVMEALGGDVAVLARSIAAGDCYPHEFARRLTMFAHGKAAKQVELEAAK